MSPVLRRQNHGAPEVLNAKPNSPSSLLAASILSSRYATASVDISNQKVNGSETSPLTGWAAGASPVQQSLAELAFGAQLQRFSEA